MQWPSRDIRWGWRLGSPGSQRAIFRIIWTFVPSPYLHPLGVYLLVVTATSPPCPSVDPAAPSTARSGSSPRDPTSQLCEGSSQQRRLPHLQLLPPTQQGLRPLFFPPLTSEGTRVRTCSSEAGEKAERQDCGVGLALWGKWAQQVTCKDKGWQTRRTGRCMGTWEQMLGAKRDRDGQGQILGTVTQIWEEMRVQHCTWPMVGAWHMFVEWMCDRKSGTLGSGRKPWDTAMCFLVSHLGRMALLSQCLM